MTSLRHNPETGRPTDTAELGLDAARASILDVGWSRTTLTDIARRAGVSRMTLYRKWPDMGSLLADLMTREWSELVHVDTTSDNARERLVRSAVGTVQAIRANQLFGRIIELDPHLVLPYLFERAGRAQRLVVDMIAEQVQAGQAAAEIRDGDPRLLARSIVLACHGHTLSAQTMTGPGVTQAKLDDELATMLDRSLQA
jgi:AcrR family transcriptional regulator